MSELTLTERFKVISALIHHICRACGTPGVSIGVLRNGEVVHVDNFGCRDLENEIEPDQHTLYYIASLTKGFTAALVATLVDEGKLKWDTPVSSLLPGFKHFDETVQAKAGLEDFLSHRTGLASKDQMWLSEFGRPSMPRSETAKFASYLETVYPFQERWLYNNWGYGLASEVIESLTGQSWSECLQERILKPLGMCDTTTLHKPPTDNYAEAYMAQADGTPLHVPRPMLEEGGLNEGAAAMQSSVSDLLVYYAHFMKALQEQSRGEASTSPLKLLPDVVRARIPLDAEPSETERSYALGWVRTQLPGRLGEVGLNSAFLREMPVVGRHMQGTRMCLYHHGSLMSFLSAVHLLPDTQSGVVVLSNSMANSDVADWISQMLLEVLMEAPRRHDFLDWAAESATA